MFENLELFFNSMNTHSMSGGFMVLFFLLSIWSIIWKGIALWKAAGNKSKIWFIALLIINTAGILEIIYIFFLSDKKPKKKNQDVIDKA